MLDRELSQFCIRLLVTPGCIWRKNKGRRSEIVALFVKPSRTEGLDYFWLLGTFTVVERVTVLPAGSVQVTWIV